MTDLADLSLAAQRELAAEMVRRSLGHFHAESFNMLHPGETISPGPHLDAMVHVLQQLAAGEINRLIITLPPRHGKSELAAASFAAWVLGNDPAAKVTVASYGLELSEPLVDKARTIVKHPRYQKLFPRTKIRVGQDRRSYFEVQGGGSVRAASKEGAMTGLGTHFLIVDDPHKAGETLSAAEREKTIEQFRTTFFNRFENLNDGRIVIVMQRLHEFDLVGWALRTGLWHHLCLPAIAEQNEDIPLPLGQTWHRRKGDVLAPRIASRRYLDEQLALMGQRYFGAQFQQNPIAAEGAQVKWEWFGQYDEMPPRTFFHKIVQSWDPAATDRIKSDYSVGLTWGFRDGEWYLLDVIRRQLAFTDLYDRVVAWHRRWRADALLIEGASIGFSLHDQVKKKARLPGIIRAPVPGPISKEDRLAAQTVHLRSGAFLLPTSAPWLSDFRHELLAFPDGTNDDQVDALTQFVKFAFENDDWVKATFMKDGRREHTRRPPPRPRSYNDRSRSQGFQDDKEEAD